MASFVDHVRIYCTAGRGGKGAVSWRREKSVPHGGPDGGDGGKGGNIVIRGNRQMWTLLDLKYRKFIKAEAGSPGEGGNRKGKDGKDLVFDVPLGTVAWDENTGEKLGEVTEEGQEILIAQGGRGGLGNWHFKSSTKQTPDYAQPGEDTEEKLVVLELKVLADVGLVGFPNAGKSTLLSVVTAAKPKIADYAFTTLVPNLGIVKIEEGGSFAMADIPGIIEGAHEGRGLGLQFLRHIERNSVLLFLVPADSADPKKEYKTLLNELKQYNPELLDKKRVLCISKADLMQADELKKLKTKFRTEKPMIISAATGAGIEELKVRLFEVLKAAQA